MFTLKELKKAVNLYSYSPKSLKPKSKKKYVGVELECILPFPSPSHYDEDEGEHVYDNTGRILLLSLFAAAGLEKKVRVGYDGSIRFKKKHECDAEVRILDTEKNIFETVEKVCKVLTDFGARVNKSCGLHVHLDMRHRPETEISTIFNNLMKSQDYLRSLVSKNRLNSSYCRKLPDTMAFGAVFERNEIGQVIYKNGIPVVKSPAGRKDVTWINALSNRYSFDHHDGLNMVTAYQEQKTFEIRFHEATLDPSAINKWIATLLKITKIGMLKEKVTVETAPKKLKIGVDNVRA